MTPTNHEPAHAADGRRVENGLAWMGGGVLTVAAVAYTLLDMGLRFGENCAAHDPSPPYVALGVGVLMVFPKTYGRATAGGVLSTVARRVGGGATTVMQAIRRKPPEEPPA